mmetsp:Transcript_53500/g.120571  ORF Transcript_53500/g.120571 Transcript_53500/m.120571 type:complete len:393 (-) Transcript_53500:137-1315(-)|eukprot:CAMPEP_0197910128 /NCGR_PEP_ID=MMETSP1439-20131203/70283_1 /TAXON_ID=66791 /ORGANISM="Gonyaulax spinifera, Strain CCMP409" /LENGTH=392 /DNA_ID=CAMNT_0043531751 /DNA_START=183 /DNA_END=1361 /DNA_ORIENTATION=-
MVQGMNLWYLGVAFEVVSTMSGTIGKQLIRLSETRKRKNPGFANICFYAGLVVNTVCGPLLDMAAYSFAAQSLIAPFGGLDVVWNAFLAPCILKEQLTRRRSIGCGLIVVGTALCGVFGNHEDSEYTLEYIEYTLVNVRVLIYALVFVVWFLINRFFLMRFPQGSAVRGVSLGCTAGTIAGNMFCVKAAIELIQRSIHEQEGEIWLHWLPYVLLLGAVFFALTNVVYMTRGLLEYEALFMVTIYEGSMIVSGCVSGAVVLMDLRGLEAWRVFLYSLGVVIIVLGMYVIFSQEAMNRSSLIAGKASIEPSAQPSPLLDPTVVQQRSLHAVCSPMASPGPLRERRHTDPVSLSPHSDVTRNLDFKDGDGSAEAVEEGGQARPRAQSAPVQLATL